MAETATYVFVDDLPEVAAARQAERAHAETILEDRYWRQENGFEPAELPVDALSTAHWVNQAEEGSTERDQLYKGLLLDCQRYVAEWYRKKKPEYFPPARHVYHEDTQEFFSHGLSIRQMTENALIPIRDDKEEEQRRINERVEDATPQILRNLGKIAIGSEAIRTISECTDTAIASYEYDMAHGKEHRGYRGYVPEIKKLMIRDISLDADPTSQDRFEEQLGLPGIYITHEIVQMTLERRGLAAAGNLDKTELHGSQILVKDDLMEFAQELDDVASEQWCTNIFMGEEVSKDYVKDYANFRTESLERQAGLTQIAEGMAVFALHLDQDGAGRADALQLVEDFVKNQLGELGKHDTSIAEQIFDENTAQRLQKVRYYESVGRFEDAERLFVQTMRQAPGGGACGAGSCGLEAVNLESEMGKRAKDRLDARAGDTITKDTLRNCKNCGQKKLVYAHNVSKVNTWCEGCDVVVKKNTTASAAKTDYALAA